MLAITLATLSLVRVSSDGLTYRQTELWSSSTRLLVTQQGFPMGRLLALRIRRSTREEAAHASGSRSPIRTGSTT